MKLFKTIDEKFEKLGFIKIKEDAFMVTYEKNLGNYIHVIDIAHKQNGNHLIQSYQRGVNSNGFNNMVGLTYKEAELCVKKMKQKGLVD